MALRVQDSAEETRENFELIFLDWEKAFDKVAQAKNVWSIGEASQLSRSEYAKDNGCPAVAVSGYFSDVSVMFVLPSLWNGQICSKSAWFDEILWKNGMQTTHFSQKTHEINSYIESATTMGIKWRYPIISPTMPRMDPPSMTR